MKFWNRTLGFLLLVLTVGCIEPYAPEVLEAPNSYLVVNGFINANGPTTIQLLRTQNLMAEIPSPVETGATVLIEAESGEKFKLTEGQEGKYTNTSLNLATAGKYRLYIKTTNGNEYISDYVAVKISPAIDKVSWKPTEDNVEIYVNTHDPDNNTKYYRWEYISTWHYRSAFFTDLKYESGEVLFRDNNDENIYDCWRSENSTSIEIGNSLKLSQDVISNHKLLAIPYNSEKLGVKYSILVKQYALTAESYKYWETLKKNTEGIGTLFDPLPSQLAGNIRCITNPQELVIGYMTATSMQEKRLFIDSNELPKEWKTFFPTCYSDTLLLADESVDIFEGGYIMPVNGIYTDSSPDPIGYLYASESCVDCRVRGTNVKPDFWE
ncbi:DUF4249 domain-containing protein [Pontibacter oryzae]|nr:DUF4249 domain-containing protein [Pontibacter oryzae]